MNKTTKEMSTYYCGTDGKIQITPVTSGTNIIGMGKVINSVKPQIPEVLKLAGLSGTDLSQENINKLYDILSKK
jgi:hypothetical protein